MTDNGRPTHYNPAMLHFTSSLLIVMVSVAALAQAPAAPRVAAIEQAIEPFIQKAEFAGVVSLVADKDKILHFACQGQSDIAGNKAMQPDSICWIASMTKPITAVAVMMMQEEGKLNVDDPVAKYIPELKDQKTADGKAYAITIRQILSHTSGMSDISSEEAKTAQTLADLVPIYAKKPLKFEPGSKWAYCQTGINTAGRIVEIVSKMSFPEFLEKRITGPLGMKDTTFYLSEAQIARLAKSYKRTPEGKLAETENFFLLGKSASDKTRFPAPNGGLFSTATDYARFLQMVLGGGTFEGKTYLKPETIKQMTTICTGDLKTGFTPGNGWGIGWCVVREPQGVTAMLSPGSCGHGGAYGTQGWIDPAKNRVYVLMLQRAGINADASDLRKAFQQSAVDSIK